MVRSYLERARATRREPAKPGKPRGAETARLIFLAEQVLRYAYFSSAEAEHSVTGEKFEAIIVAAADREGRLLGGQYRVQRDANGVFVGMEIIPQSPVPQGACTTLLPRNPPTPHEAMMARGILQYAAAALPAPVATLGGGHVDSGEQCLRAHVKDGVLQPACKRCAICGNWLRPEQYQTTCPGPQLLATDDDDGTPSTLN